MKIRDGFVSNSSSSSFILVSLENTRRVLKEKGRKDNKNFYKEDIILVEANDESEYDRHNICILRTTEEKLKYLSIMYALSCIEKGDVEEYFLKMDKYVHKMNSLGKKYNKYISISIPAIKGGVIYDTWDSNKGKYVPLEKPSIQYYIESSTECRYVNDIKELVEDKDTRYLESFIFNPNSFCVLGGDEYEDTFKLQKEAMEKVDYPYFRIEDYEENSPNKWCYTQQYKEYRENHTPIQVTS